METKNSGGSKPQKQHQQTSSQKTGGERPARAATQSAASGRIPSSSSSSNTGGSKNKGNKNECRAPPLMAGVFTPAPPPPYQDRPPAYGQNLGHNMYQQQAPGYQQSPMFCQQTPLQITLQIQPPSGSFQPQMMSGNFPPHGNYQYPPGQPFMNFQHQITDTSFNQQQTSQPVPQRNTQHRPNFGTQHQLNTATLKDDSSSVCSASSNYSRGKHSQTGRGQQHVRGRSGSAGNSKVTSVTNNLVNQTVYNQRKQSGRGQGNFRGRGFSPSNSNASKLLESDANTQIRRDQQESKRQGPAARDTLNQNVANNMAYSNTKGDNALSCRSERGRGRGNIRRAGMSRAGKYVVSRSVNVNSPQEPSVGSNFNHFYRGRGYRGIRGTYGRVGRGMRGGAIQQVHNQYSQDADNNFDNKSVSDMTSEAGESVDDSIADSATNEGDVFVGIQNREKIVRKQSSRGRGGGRGSFRGRGRQLDRSRCANWVLSVTSGKIIQESVDDTESVKDQLSVSNDSDWLDDDSSATDEVVSDVPNVSFPKLRGQSVTKGGRGRGSAASGKVSNRQKTARSVLLDLNSEITVVEDDSKPAIPIETDSQSNCDDQRTEFLEDDTISIISTTSTTDTSAIKQKKKNKPKKKKTSSANAVTTEVQNELKETPVKREGVLLEGNDTGVSLEATCKTSRTRAKKNQIEFHQRQQDGVESSQAETTKQIQPKQTKKQLPGQASRKKGGQDEQLHQQAQNKSFVEQKQQLKGQEPMRENDRSPSQPQSDVSIQPLLDLRIPQPLKPVRRIVTPVEQSLQLNCDDQPIKCLEDGTVSDISANGTTVNSESKKKAQNKPKKTKADNHNKIKEIPLKCDGVSLEGSNSDVGSEAASASKSPVKKIDENTLLGSIVKDHGSSCRVEHLYEILGSSNPSDVIQLLKSFRRIKVLENESALCQSVVFVLVKGLRLCANSLYCKKPDCPHLHMCSNFITGVCTFGERCRRGHSFHEGHNMEVVEKSGIDKICNDENVLLDLVRCCTPIVCRAHNDAGGPRCAEPDSCLQLHVCSMFVRGRCLIPEASCEYGHDLFTERNVVLLKLLELIHLQTKDKNLLQRMILTSERSSVSAAVADGGESRGKTTPKKSRSYQTGMVPTPSPRNSCASVASKAAAVDEDCCGDHRIADALAAALNRSLNTSDGFELSRGSKCDSFEQHQCDLSLKCTERHGSLPYYWCVRSVQDWIPLENQTEVEQAFCDPNRRSCIATFMDSPIIIDFDTMKCQRGEVQRLSTPSYVNCRNKTDGTRWRWYWKEGDQKSGQVCILYEEDKPPYQDVLEAKYQNDKTQSCCFETENSDCNQYLIDFEAMKQTNLKTGFIRDLCRRPAFTQPGQLLSPALCHFDSNKLPVGEDWIPMNTERDLWTDLIPVNNKHSRMRHLYGRVLADFHQTLPKVDFRIKNVFYIQNLDMWKKFQEQKGMMEKSQPDRASRLEKRLFHGTLDEKTVRCICHQNFDPRMYGVNGTKYGRGAYFATTAKYSHSYTQPVVSRDGSRFMFFARVLVGRSVLGKSEYQRPPPLDPNQPQLALYDTCVDDVAKPTIFVVFNNAQCYPEFLIEYQDLRPPIVLEDAPMMFPNPPINVPSGSPSMPGASPPNDPQSSMSPDPTSPTTQSSSAKAAPESNSKPKGCAVM